jgi:hypothetical protein
MARQAFCHRATVAGLRLGSIHSKISGVLDKKRACSNGVCLVVLGLPHKYDSQGSISSTFLAKSKWQKANDEKRTVASNSQKKI